MNEVKIFENLSIKNSDVVLKYYGHFIIEEPKRKKAKIQLYIFMELSKYSLLNELVELKNKNQHYESNNLARKIHDLLKMFLKLSKENITYCNIEPRNILIAFGNKFKLGDFYLAKASEESDKLILDAVFHDFERTPNYMAPELKLLVNKELLLSRNLSKKKELSTEKSDVFSLGLVFLMMIEPRSINDLNENDYYHRLDGFIENLELGWAKALLRWMLAKNCKERPSFEEAFKMLIKNSEFNSCLNSSN